MQKLWKFVIVAIICLTHQQPTANASIANCNFEDTVDLSLATKFSNGSYLYENKILIPANQVATYDYEEVHDGERLPLPPHPRGCVCKHRNCIKFCCHPTKELVANYSRQCASKELNEELSYDPYINVITSNGSRMRTHVTEDFVVVQGVPCEGAYHLIPELDEDDKWELFANGTLLRHYDKALISKRDYCLLPYKLDDGQWVLNPMNCPILNEATLSLRINTIAMAISVPFIILTILVYAFIPELRNLHGKCLICYLTSLAVGYTILSTITLSEIIFPNFTCSFLGYMGYFFFLSAFFWLSVISFDLWQNFRLTGPFRFGQNKRFLLYSVYAWGIPISMTFIVIGIQHSDIDSYFKPGIGDDYCWLKTNDWSAMIYFFGINLVIVLIDMILFSMTYYKIVVMQRDIDRIMRSDGGDKKHKLHQHKNNFGLFLRLFLIMGISWLLDIFSYIEGLLHPDVINPLYYISDFMNSILGLLIFICFVLKRKVLALIKRRFQVIRGGASQRLMITRRATSQISLSKIQTTSVTTRPN